MRLDIGLSETEIHVIRIALGDSVQSDLSRKSSKTGWPYSDGHVETLEALQLKFSDLAKQKLPTFNPFVVKVSDT